MTHEAHWIDIGWTTHPEFTPLNLMPIKPLECVMLQHIREGSIRHPMILPEHMKVEPR